MTEDLNFCNTPPTAVAFACMMQFRHFPVSSLLTMLTWVHANKIEGEQVVRPSAVTLRRRKV